MHGTGTPRKPHCCREDRCTPPGLPSPAWVRALGVAGAGDGAEALCAPAQRSAAGGSTHLREVFHAVRVGQQVAGPRAVAPAAVSHHHKARGGGGVLPLALPGPAGPQCTAGGSCWDVRTHSKCKGHATWAAQPMRKRPLWHSAAVAAGCDASRRSAAGQACTSMRTVEHMYSCTPMLLVQQRASAQEAAAGRCWGGALTASSWARCGCSRS